MVGKFNRAAPGNRSQQKHCQHAGSFDWATEEHLCCGTDHGSLV